MSGFCQRLALSCCLVSVDGFEFFPSVIKVLTKNQAAQTQYVFCTGLTPEDAGLLESATDNGFAACFDDTGTEEQSLLAVAPGVGSC